MSIDASDFYYEVHFQHEEKDKTWGMSKTYDVAIKAVQALVQNQLNESRHKMEDGRIVALSYTPSIQIYKGISHPKICQHIEMIRSHIHNETKYKCRQCGHETTINIL